MARAGKIRIMVKDRMNLHKRRRVNVGEKTAYTQIIEPRSLDFSSERDIEFFISGNTSKLVDFQRSKLVIEFSLEKRNPAHEFQVNPNEKDAATNEMVTPIDGFFHTMWKSIKMKWNKEWVSSDDNDQAYRAYLDLLTNVGNEELDDARDNLLYTRNDGEEDVPNPFAAGNGGGMIRWNRTSGKRKIRLSGPLITDLWKTEKLLIGGVDILIQLKPAFDKFRFQMSSSGDTLREQFVMKIQTCYLKLMYVELRDKALRAQEHSISRSPFSYPFVRTDIDILQLRQGVLERRIPDIYAREIPSRLLVMMVKQDAYTGDYRLNPFNFVHNNITSASFHIDNMIIPAEPYTFEDLENNERCLHDAVNALREYGGKKNLGINLENFTKGKFILVFNTDPTVERDLRYWGMPKSGSTKLHLTFASAIDAEYDLILYATFPGVVEIDKDRVVTKK